jgi:hypothetical protein
MTFLGDGIPQWIAGQGRLSNVVRQHLVASQLADVTAGGPPLRVLDAGCGQGTQALGSARAGHAVTGSTRHPPCSPGSGPRSPRNRRTSAGASGWSRAPAPTRRG